MEPHLASTEPRVGKFTPRATVDGVFVVGSVYPQAAPVDSASTVPWIKRMVEVRAVPRGGVTARTTCFHKLWSYLKIFENFNVFKNSY